jgi:hypothetical protein
MTLYRPVEWLDVIDLCAEHGLKVESQKKAIALMKKTRRKRSARRRIRVIWETTHDERANELLSQAIRVILADPGSARRTDQRRSSRNGPSTDNH